MDRVRHPLFARLYQCVSPALERTGVAGHRERLLAGLTGRVVEVGAGNGLNFGHYPASVTEVVAVEPERYFRARAEEASRRAPVPVRIVAGTAAHLPLLDASMDAGVASLVLCSVLDQSSALTELRRVVRPGGELRFYEHVAADDPNVARWQRRVDPIWKHLAGGCHLTRHTEDAIRAAGFVVDECDRFPFRPSRLATLTAEHILGRAHRPLHDPNTAH